MARVFTLNRAGGAEVLKQLAAAAISDLAQQVASAAGEGVQVELLTTDRARADVKVPAERQAVDGVLSKAASQVGLVIHPPKHKRADKPTRKKTKPLKEGNNNG